MFLKIYKNKSNEHFLTLPLFKAADKSPQPMAIRQCASHTDKCES